ncbi:MAG: autotransporter-associated beta strand repeat-containing protein [Kiritimatiellia bacterium]
MKYVYTTIVCVVLLMVMNAVAGWNGAGTPGGTAGTDISETANWSGGVIDNDFTPITEDVTLVVTQNHNFPGRLNFATPAGVKHQINITGTGTITMDSTQVQPIAPSNTLSKVIFEQGLTLHYTGTGNRFVSGKGELVVNAKITGSVALGMSATLGAPSVHFRNTKNEFTGAARGTTGTRVYFPSVAGSGLASALGAGDQIYGNYSANFIFNGTRDAATNRRITIERDSGVWMRNDSANAELSFTGIYESKEDAIKHKYAIAGISAGESRIDSNLANTSQTRLEKAGSGVWRLTGHNTFPGYSDASQPDVAVAGGTLIADYANDVVGAGSNRLFASGSSVYLNDGHLVFQGKAGAGNTTYQAMGPCKLDSYGANALTVDSNGGDATTVVLDGLTSAGSNLMMLFDISEAATLKLSGALQPDSGSVRMVNGMVMSWDGTASYILFRDSQGKVGFPTQDNEQRIVLHTNTVNVTESNAVTYAGEHLALTGDVTRTEDLSFSTMVVDARIHPVTLDMGGKTFQDDNTSIGRGVVAYGNYPVTVQNGSHGGQASSYLFNYGTGKLTWDLTGSKVYTIGGTGLTELTAAQSAYFFIIGGTARLTADNNSTVGKHLIAGDGVLELGADLNGAAYGDYTRNFGNASDNSVQFPAGGGFSAHGRDRIVNLGGAGNELAWGAGTENIKDGKPFVLSSPYADSTLIFENAIDLNYYPREFRVRDGSAAVDARLTGTIRSDYFGGSLVKSGDGTLELTGAQTYLGNVSVINGGLRLGADDIYANGSNDLVLDNATLDAGEKRNEFASLELLADSSIDLGGSTTALAFADSSDKLWTGTLTITGTLGADTLRFGTNNQGLTEAQLATITYEESLVRLDDHGYLVKIQQGTVILVY